MERFSRYIENETAYPHKWFTAIYLRISREDGDKEESDSISNQKALLMEYLTSQEDMELYDVYIDDGYTGTNFERPDFQRMMEDIRLKRVNCIIVKDLSRLGRNYIEVGRYIEQIFPMLNIRFIALGDSLDSELRPDRMYDISVPIKNIMNDEYCKDISRKIKSALDVKRRNGQFIGNYAPYGYQKSPTDRHKLVIDPEVADVVRDIFQWYIGGMSIARIARRLNDRRISTPSQYKITQGMTHFGQHSCGSMCGKLWSLTTIRRILTDEVYIGNLVQGQYKNKSYRIKKLTTVEKSKWITVKNTHEPLVSNEMFEQAQERLRLDTRTSPKEITVHPLAGLVRCADCRMGMNRKKNQYATYFVCSTHKMMPEACTHTHSIRADQLTDIVLRALQLQIEAVMDTEKALASLQKSSGNAAKTRLAVSVQNNRRELERCQQAKTSLYSDWKIGDITRDEYLHMKQDFENRIRKLEEIIQKLTEEQRRMAEEKAAQNDFVSRFQRYRNITELTHEVAVKLIENVYVTRDRDVIIDFKFADEYAEVLQYLKDEQAKSAG